MKPVATLLFHAVRLPVVTIAFLGLAACSGGGGSAVAPPPAGGDPSVAARTSTIAPGDADCPAGGVLVETGIDENANGVLDDAEVDTSEKVCHGSDGADGLDALIALSPEPAGDNCPGGGVRIDAGIDADGDGSLDPAEVTQTEYVCNARDASGSWQEPTLAGPDNDSPVEALWLGANGSGTAVAVWVQEDDGLWGVWANRYEPGAGWGGAEEIWTGPIPERVDPRVRVAVGADGTAVAVWNLRGEGGDLEVWTNRYEPGTGWDGAKSLAAADGGALPCVAVDAEGNAVVVWVVNKGVWASRYEPGVGWSPAKEVSTGATGVGRPQVAVDGSGNAVVVWQQEEGEDWYVWANRYEADAGRWGTAERIEPEVVDMVGIDFQWLEEDLRPQVAVNTDGTAVAVWQNAYIETTGTYTTTAAVIGANRYEPGVGWGHAEWIVSSVDVETPQVVVTDDGAAVVVWQHEGFPNTGLDAGVVLKRYEPDVGWGREIPIETGAGGSANPRVAVNDNGNVVVVWERFDGARTNIYANRYDLASGWGMPALLETNNLHSALEPAVALDPDGNALAVWRQDTGTSVHVWSSRWPAP